jgi:hypothetical protein
VMIPLSGRVPGRASKPSQTRVDNGGGYETFHGWRLLAFRVFLRMWIYRRKGEVGGCSRGPHPGAVQPGGPRHHQMWSARCLMSTHASILVDSVGALSAEVCRTATSFP